MYECANCGDTFTKKKDADYHAETCEPSTTEDGYSSISEISETEE